ncbi:NUDIX domain-containing protein [Smaragdicoccus niigatensis]|uniref:NUDIX domain-containing protein n=1 Tax=Smaragdicoccus niigatensis TaxID=359359 RepID=UPI000376B28A|nr:NUDIX hydrolase [Smaragdicoccus niigatensis]
MTEPTNERHIFEVVASRTAYESPIIAVREDDVVMPGGDVATRSIVEHYGAVAVVAVDMDGNVVLVDQYRQPVGRRLLELPAGILDKWGEDPLEAAKRELAEETGLAAKTWFLLTDLVLSPGFSDETIRIYFATGLSEVSRPEPEHEEADMVVLKMPLNLAVSAVLSGLIENSVAAAGILAAAASRDGYGAARSAGAPWPGRSLAFAKRKAGKD